MNKKYTYTGKPYKHTTIDNLSPETRDILISWGYILETVEEEQVNESIESQQVELKPRKKSVPATQSDSGLDS